MKTRIKKALEDGRLIIKWDSTARSNMSAKYSIYIIQDDYIIRQIFWNNEKELQEILPMNKKGNIKMNGCGYNRIEMIAMILQRITNANIMKYQTIL